MDPTSPSFWIMQQKGFDCRDTRRLKSKSQNGLKREQGCGFMFDGFCEVGRMPTRTASPTGLYQATFLLGRAGQSCYRLTDKGPLPRAFKECDFVERREGEVLNGLTLPVDTLGTTLFLSRSF